jgi:hypothetical protein
VVDQSNTNTPRVLRAVRVALVPIARLLLRAGIGFREFAEICKDAFVTVATEDFGVRGRPTNISRVSALTGVSRKEVSRLRESPISPSGASSAVSNALSVVLHHWHHDIDFCTSPGRPRPLAFAGDDSFSSLVKRYAGDVPPGAVRAELKRGGALEEDEGGLLMPLKHWFMPLELDANFFESMSFSLSNLASTMAHNASSLDEGHLDQERGRMERYVWVSSVSEADAREFKLLAESRALALVEELERWVAERERAYLAAKGGERLAQSPRSVGLGFYYFERDREAVEADPATTESGSNTLKKTTN